MALLEDLNTLCRLTDELASALEADDLQRCQKLLAERQGPLARISTASAPEDRQTRMVCRKLAEKLRLGEADLHQRMRERKDDLGRKLAGLPARTGSGGPPDGWGQHTAAVSREGLCVNRRV
jgi:hypothetical protein